ncbi:MAG TPA: DUF4339 domain-containing protein [Acidobacteriaceae bacterium]|jgi:hypothetical protein
MLYHVARGSQTYGPYTLEDLKNYVASGNILLTDLARGDDSPDWVPVSQILGMAPPTPLSFQQLPSQQAPPGSVYPATNVAYPDAPNLNWGLVLLFSFFTCGMFMIVWNLILSSWLKRVQPNSKAIFYYIAAIVLLFCQIAVGTHTHVQAFHPGIHWWMTYYTGHPLRNFLALTTWIVRLIARFTMRANLEEHFNGPEPVGLSLNGVMTFFFGGLYFTYHLNRINELKRIARYRGAAI